MKVKVSLSPPIYYLAFHHVGPWDLILYVGRRGRGICRGYKGVYGPSTFAGCKHVAKKQWGKT